MPGLSELRLSVKLDVADTPEESRATIDDAVRKMALVKHFIPQAMVEMPVIPGTKEAMELLLCELDSVGAMGASICWNSDIRSTIGRVFPKGLQGEKSSVPCFVQLELCGRFAYR